MGGLATLTDPVDLQVSGQDFQDLVIALVEAFPDYPALAMMVRFRLSLALPAVAAATNGLDFVAFTLITDQQAKGHFLRLLAAARASRPGNPKLALVAERFELAMQTPSAPELERVVSDTNSFLDSASWRGKLAEIEDRVCRVELKTNQGMVYGTGFLVGPALVLTNYHVVDAVIAGERNEYSATGAKATRADVVVRFDYKVPFGGAQPLVGIEVRLAEIVDYSPYSAVDFQPLPRPEDPDVESLDYALLRLETPPGQRAIGDRPVADNAEPGAPARGAIQIPAADWRFEANAPLVIVQHPDGEPIKLAIDTNSVLALNANSTRVTYRTNTKGGSSGSPCFNQHLDLVALHHAGDPKYAPLYRPNFNQGIPIAAIRDLIKKRGRSEGLAIG